MPFRPYNNMFSTSTPVTTYVKCINSMFFDQTQIKLLDKQTEQKRTSPHTHHNPPEGCQQLTFQFEPRMLSFC